MATQGFAVYKDLLAIPHVARFSIFGVVAQFPFSMLAMAILIGVRDAYGSYTYAGIASASMAIAGAIFSPEVGKLVDYWGQRRVGVIVGAIWVVSHVALAAVLIFKPPVWVMFTVSVLIGINVPVGSMLRTRWTIVLAREPLRLNSALSLTSVLEECMWVIGGPVSTILAAGVSPLAAIAFSLVTMVVGLWVFLGDSTFEPTPARHLPSDDAGASRPNPSERGAGPSSAKKAKPTLMSNAFVALLVVLIAYGGFQSTTGIAIVAFSKEQGYEAYAGFVTACFSIASLTGALVYGMRAWRWPLWKRFYLSLTAVAIGCSALVFVNSMWTAGLVMFVAGLFQAPTIVNINQMIIKMIPASRLTEGMAFQGSLWVVGISSANLISSVMIDRYGSMGGFGTIVGYVGMALVVGVIGLPAIRARLSEPTVLRDA